MRYLSGPSEARRGASLAAAIALILAGCSSASPTVAPATVAPATAGSATVAPATASAADAMIAAAKAWTEKAKAIPSGWGGPTTSPKPLAGKRIAIVSCGQLTEGCARPSRASADAVAKLGWTSQIFDGQGTTDAQLAAINAAVDSNFDGIILEIVDPGVTLSAVQRALDAKIPVVTLAVPPFSEQRKALLAQIPDVSWPYELTGQNNAYYMIANTPGGKINAFLLNGSDTLAVKFGQHLGVFEILNDPTKCPDCKTNVKEFTVGDLTTLPAKYAVAAVQADPTINWIDCYDFCLARATDGLIAAGLTANLKGAGYDCNAENLKLMQSGTVQVVCQADPREWEAWAAVDNVNRLMQGQPAVEQNIPVREFDASNMSELTATDLKDGWQGGVDFRAEYLKLWGIQ